MDQSDALDDAFDACLNASEAWYQQGHSEGVAAGKEDAGAFELGLVKGRELAVEVGFTRGFCEAIRAHQSAVNAAKWNRLERTLELLEKHLSAIDWSQSAKPEFSDHIEAMRAKYKQLCSNLGFDNGGTIADTGDLF